MDCLKHSANGSNEEDEGERDVQSTGVVTPGLVIAAAEVVLLPTQLDILASVGPDTADSLELLRLLLGLAPVLLLGYLPQRDDSELHTASLSSAGCKSAGIERSRAFIAIHWAQTVYTVHLTHAGREIVSAFNFDKQEDGPEKNNPRHFPEIVCPELSLLGFSYRIFWYRMSVLSRPPVPGSRFHLIARCGGRPGQVI